MGININNLHIIMGYLAEEEDNFVELLYEELGEEGTLQFEKLKTSKSIIKWIEENNLTGHIWYNYLVLFEDLKSLEK